MTRMKNTTTILIVVLLSLHFAYAQQATPVAGGKVSIAPNVNTEVIAEELNFLVNTPYKELGPMPTKDGKRLYFSRQGYPENVGGVNDEDIWYCEFDDVSQSWTKAINAGPPLNNTGPNFITGIGRNGDTLLLGNVYGKKGKMKAGVSISIRVGELWSFPMPINIADDYNLSAKAGYDLSSDRTTMIIAQQKSDSKGGLDLYAAFRDPDATYPYSATESVNLGDVINSFGDETSPWLAYDNRTLYFSSDGHNGYGELDVFMCKRLDNTWTNWSPPVNLGPGINSRYDDVSFNYNPTDRYAYFSRGVTPSNVDIYRVDMTNLFKEIAVEGDGATSVEIGQTKVVNNVFADNSSEISKGAVTEIQNILNYLAKNNTMVVQITAHSNPHDNRATSIQLSNQRASNVVDYLVRNGIDKKRLSYHGLGHDVVVNSKASTATSATSIGASVEFKLINY
jgi:outer membrane protein OmpA-like peptidoglycan-associated protein